MSGPVEAMHAALWRSMDRRMGWPTSPDDQATWISVADAGLDAARASWSIGVRGLGVSMAAAHAMLTRFWMLCDSAAPPSAFDRGGEIDRHWRQAAEALIAAAQSETQQARAA
jgi:hypothetical protein